MKRLVVGVVVVIASVFVVSLSVSPLLSQVVDYCEGNFDYDQDVDGMDAAVFKDDFGRSPFKNPCPPPNPAPALVPKTGRTLCYDEDGNPRDCAGTGEDAEYQTGVAWPNPRFTDNGDGTVTDNLTGLIWLKDANCIETNYPEIGYSGSVTWQKALDFVAGINAGTYPDCGAGSTDWRLPNIYELTSLVHRGYLDPAVPNTAGTGQWSQGDPFTNVQSEIYWSSTTEIRLTYYAWYVGMVYGSVFSENKNVTLYVWPVRGPE